jgi:hypothetical protein
LALLIFFFFLPSFFLDPGLVASRARSSSIIEIESE